MSRAFTRRKPHRSCRLRGGESSGGFAHSFRFTRRRRQGYSHKRRASRCGRYTMLWENSNVKSGLEQIDRGVLGKPEDLAAVIAFLGSDEAEFVRGSSVIVDGGRLG